MPNDPPAPRNAPEAGGAALAGRLAARIYLKMVEAGHKEWIAQQVRDYIRADRDHASDPPAPRNAPEAGGAALAGRPEADLLQESATNAARNLRAVLELNAVIRRLREQNHDWAAAIERFRSDLDAKTVELGFEQEHRTKAEANRDAARNAVAMVAAELHQATLDRDQARACVAGLVAALEELADIVEGVRNHESGCELDCFTTQPARIALAAVPESLRKP